MTTPETKVKNKIRYYLRKHGFYIRSIPSNAYSRAGNPDYYAIKDGNVLFIECKSNKGKLSPTQIETKIELEKHGANYILAYGIEDIFDYLDEKGIKL